METQKSKSGKYAWSLHDVKTLRKENKNTNGGIKMEQEQKEQNIGIDSFLFLTGIGLCVFLCCAGAWIISLAK